MENHNQKQNPNPLLMPLAIIGAGLIIAGAIVFTQIKNQEWIINNVADKDKNEDNNSQESEEVSDIFDSQGEVKEIIISEKDHIRGDVNAPVTIVEYSDFQCPFCKKFHPTLEKILKDYPNKVRWVLKHFPLESRIHPEATPAAEASECAWEQKGNEGFWKFADYLFNNQERLGKELYQEAARKLNLDMNQFDQCLSSRKYQEKVKEDFKQGVSLNVRGTPVSFINGRIIKGALPYEMIKEAVDKTLGKNN